MSMRYSHFLCVLVLLTAAVSVHAQEISGPPGIPGPASQVVYVPLEEPVAVPSSFIPANSARARRRITRPYHYYCYYYDVYTPGTCENRIDAGDTFDPVQVQTNQTIYGEYYWDNKGGPNDLGTIDAESASLLVQWSTNSLQLIEYQIFQSGQFFSCSSSPSSEGGVIGCSASTFPNEESAYLYTEHRVGEYTNQSFSVSSQINAGNSIEQAFSQLNIDYYMTQPLSSVYGWVYHDFHGDNFMNVSDVGIAEFPLYLDVNRDLTIDGSDLLSTTDSEGGFVFDSVPAGDFNLLMLNDDNATSLGYTPLDGFVYSGSVSAGEEEEVRLAMYIPIIMEFCVFEDLDLDGTRDAGEGGLAGATVSWVRGSSSSSVITGETGCHEEMSLLPGSYLVSVTLPQGYVSTTTTETEIVITSGSDPTLLEYGSVVPGTISGTKYHDLNGNGQRDDGEPGIEGWTISVDGGGSAVTDADGNYTITGVTPGTVTVSEEDREGWAASAPEGGSQQIQVASGESVSGVDFFNYQPPAIVVVKRQDTNGNGEADDGEEPLPGWEMQLTWEGGSMSGVTGENGSVTFDGLVAGRPYVIAEESQAGWILRFPTSGNYEITPVSNQVFIAEFRNEPPPPSAVDMGDALAQEDPDHPEIPWGYPVTLAQNGARHVVSGTVRIGDRIDPEADGQSSTFADGDDNNPSTDAEDGIEFGPGFESLFLALEGDPGNRTYVPGMVRGQLSEIIILPSTTGRIDAWFDWNRDGDWDDDGEWALDGAQVHPMQDTLEVTIPTDAAAGFTFSRFRFSPNGTNGPTGLESIGEVEDYLMFTVNNVSVGSAGDTGDSVAGDGICDDGTGQCTLRAAIEEANATGDPVVLTFASFGKSAVVITPQSPLPAFTAPIILQGNGELEIDGSAAGAGAHGLHLQTNGAAILNTAVYNFGGDGIRVEGNNNTVERDSIHANSGAGVRIVSGTGNRVRKTSINGNGALGIDLGAEGRTDNDPGDGDSGANNLVNTPVLSLVTAENLHFEGSLDSQANATFDVDFFSNNACDASGAGQGRLYLGSIQVTTDGTGAASFTADLENAQLNVGEAVTATATDPDGNTSEFSECFTAVTTAIERLPGEELPNGYALFQNYPNPFNPVTRIHFAIPRAEFVTIDVYDVLGKHVARLVHETIEAGEYTISYDASALPSGTYLYRITSGSWTDSRSFTLLK